MINPREAALLLCCKVEQEGAYSNLLLQDFFRQNEWNTKDKNLVVRIVYGVIQYQLRLDYILSQFSSRKPSRMDLEIRMILRIAVYQAEFMDRIPDYALVNESVALTKELGKQKYSGFVNGVLRSYLRDKEQIVYPKSTLHYMSTYYSYPQWLVQLIRDKYKNKTEWILKQGNVPPPVSIRVNQMKTDAQSLTRLLQDEGVHATCSDVLENCLLLDHGLDLSKSKLFLEGYFTPQDTSSILAAHLLHPGPNQTVIDVCSAPGGKSTYLAEQMNGTGKVIACDIYPHKLQLIEQAAKRLGLKNIETVSQDATQQRSEWNASADCVLVDAPCSGLGIIRRKPEIKWSKSLSACKKLAAVQYQILETAAYYVKPGGELIYSTCTLTNEENNDVFFRFLREHREFQAVDFSACVPEIWQDSARLGNIQILPGELCCDGFYIAKMKRNS